MLFNQNLSLCTGADIGRVIYADQQEADVYIDHLAGTVDTDLEGMRILVDCANGAASATAGRLFDRFPKLHTDIINADPNGININKDCGSTHMEQLSAMVKAGQYDLGIAFDGDADRCLAVDENGVLIDGDQVLAICGAALDEQGELNGHTIVGTVMSNLGLHLFAEEHNLSLFCTAVGDRNVLEKMEEGNYVLGGEQSGHTIFRRYATTGDGELTALQLLAVLHKSGKSASQLAGICSRYPQVLLNVAVSSRERIEEIMESSWLREAIKKEEKILAGSGRILVRPSGTELLIRVMVEAKEKAIADAAAEELSNLIKNKG